MLMNILTYVNLYLLVIAVSLSLAVGLFTLGELMEEYSILSCKILRILVICIIFLHIGLVITDNFSLWRSFISIVAQILYYNVLKSFPIIKVTDKILWLSAIFFIINNVIWYLYFSLNSWKYTIYQTTAFFTLLWLIPLALFISLGFDDTLPGNYVSRTNHWSLIDFIRSLSTGHNKRKKQLNATKRAKFKNIDI